MQIIEEMHQHMLNNGVILGRRIIQLPSVQFVLERTGLVLGLPKLAGGRRCVCETIVY
jgi:hypothetical protein